MHFIFWLVVCASDYCASSSANCTIIDGSCECQQNNKHKTYVLYSLQRMIDFNVEIRYHHHRRQFTWAWVCKQYLATIATLAHNSIQFRIDFRVFSLWTNFFFYLYLSLSLSLSVFFFLSLFFLPMLRIFTVHRHPIYILISVFESIVFVLFRPVTPFLFSHIITHSIRATWFISIFDFIN